MATAALQPARECLEDWRQESARCEEDLNETFEALEGFQRNLESWQQRLVLERKELELERAEVQQLDTATAECEQMLAGAIAAHEEELSSSQERATQLEEELTKASAARLSAESAKAQLAVELDQARRKRQELETQLEQNRAEMSRQNQHWSEEFNRVVQMLAEQNSEQDPPGSCQEEPSTPATPIAVAPIKSSDPVLGSVVAQFGKLRQQRADRVKS